MARYQRIFSQIWHDEKFVQLSDDARYLFLYLITSPHNNCLGIYSLPKEYICGDLRWLRERLGKPFRELCAQGLINYDESVNLVLIVNQLKYNPIDNPNQASSAVKVLKTMPKSSLFSDVVKRLEKQFHKGLRERLQKQVGEGYAHPEYRIQNTETEYRKQNTEGRIQEQNTETGTETRTEFKKDIHRSPEPGETAGVSPGPPSSECKSKSPYVRKEPAKAAYTQEYTAVIDDLNLCIGSSYKASTPKTQQLIRARLKEGFTLEDFKTVHRKKYRDWGHDPEMQKFLRPETLYSTKFEGYLNQQEKMPLSQAGAKTLAAGMAWLEEEKRKEAEHAG